MATAHVRPILIRRKTSVPLQILFLLIAAFAVFIIVPIALLLTAIEHFRHIASERPSSGPRMPSLPIRVIRGQFSWTNR